MDILLALEWIHERGLVLRDVRSDNVIVVQDAGSNERRARAVLVDFDRAAPIRQNYVYEGGYICCPEEVLYQAKPVADEITAAAAHSEKESEGDNMHQEDQGLPVSPHPTMPSTGLARNPTQFPLPSPTQPRSPRSLDHVLYSPHPRHDYFALALLLNRFIFPFTCRRYADHKLEDVTSNEMRRLFALWDGLKNSAMWGAAVKCAQREHVKGVWTDWESCLEIIIML